MTKPDAVEAAREAVIMTNTFPTDPVFLHRLSLYEAAVRADERAKVQHAQWCTSWVPGDPCNCSQGERGHNAPR